MWILSSFTLNDDIPLITLCHAWCPHELPEMPGHGLVVSTHVPVATRQTADVRAEEESSANHVMEYNTGTVEM